MELSIDIIKKLYFTDFEPLGILSREAPISGQCHTTFDGGPTIIE